MSSTVKKADKGDFQRLQSIDPRTWTVVDVGKWLDLIDMGAYKIKFIENDISGEELFELNSNELQVIGMTKLGHRKKLLRKVKALQKMDEKAFLNDDDTRSASSSSSHEPDKSSSDASRSRGGKSARLTFKGRWEGTWIIIKTSSDLDLHTLKKKVKKEVKRSVDIFYKDADGDEVQLRRSRDLRNAIEESNGTVRLVFKPRAGEGKGKGARPSAASRISSVESGVLEKLMDAVAVIDSKGEIVLWNAAAEKMFGFSKAEAIGENIKIVQQESDAESHDFYLWRYVKDRKPRIVGKEGRVVIGRHKNGFTVPLLLTVTETTSSTGELLFTGTMKRVGEARENTALSSFAMLDQLLQPAIVINSEGILQCFNKQAQHLLGYDSLEVLGRKVNMLMPPPYSIEHDSYLKKYMETGESKIIGTSRDVVALHKNGTPKPVNLSLSVTNDNGNIYFTGILQSIDEREKPAASAEKFVASQKIVLDSLLIPAALIDAKGTLHVFNKAACELFGYRAEDVLGKNVSMLMPAPEREKHDGYLRAYVRRNGTNSKVVGIGRDVVGVTSKGTMIPIHLSVSENRDNKGGHFFSGILQKV